MTIKLKQRKSSNFAILLPFAPVPHPFPSPPDNSDSRC